MHSQAQISFELIREHFNLPILQAAKKLGICATLLKKLCRKHGVVRWPHRKVRSLQKLLEQTERCAERTMNAAEREKMLEKVEAIQHKLDEILECRGSSGSRRSGSKSATETRSRRHSRSHPYAAGSAECSFSEDDGDEEDFDGEEGFEEEWVDDQTHSPASPPTNNDNNMEESPLLAAALLEFGRVSSPASSLASAPPSVSSSSAATPADISPLVRPQRVPSPCFSDRSFGSFSAPCEDSSYICGPEPQSRAAPRPSLSATDSFVILPALKLENLKGVAPRPRKCFDTLEPDFSPSVDIVQSFMWVPRPPLRPVH